MILQTPLRDKLEPVIFNLSVSLHEQKPKARRSLQNLDSYPILSQEQKVTERAEVWSDVFTQLSGWESLGLIQYFLIQRAMMPL